MAKSERKVQLIKDFETKISEVNKACTNGTNADVEGKLAELVNIEKEYRSIREDKEISAPDRGRRLGRS